MSDRNGLPVTGHLLLHRTYNPSASHPLSTSPYTGEAKGGRAQLAQHRVTGRQGAMGRGSLRGSQGPLSISRRGKISENRRLTKFGKTGILRPLPNRSQPEGGAQDDQRKHGLVRIGRKEAWTEGALRTHAALRSKTAFFCALSVFLQDGERFFCAFPKISFVL